MTSVTKSKKKTQYEKIKGWMNQLYRLDPDSVQFTNISQLCADRITWAYKFKKITESQKDELCEEMIRILKGEY